MLPPPCATLSCAYTILHFPFTPPVANFPPCFQEYNFQVAICGPISENCTEEVTRVVFQQWIDCSVFDGAPPTHCIFIDRWHCSTGELYQVDQVTSGGVMLCGVWWLLIVFMAVAYFGLS